MNGEKIIPSFLTLDMSEIWGTLKPIVEDMGESSSMAKVLKAGLQCWEYRFWVPEEYPNILADAADAAIEDLGVIAARSMFELMFPSGNVDVNDAASIKKYVIEQVISKDNHLLNDVRACYSRVLDTVAVLIDGVIPKDVKDIIFERRCKIHKCKFIVVSQKITAFIVFETGGHNPISTNDVPMYEEYKNIKALKDEVAAPSERTKVALMAAKAQSKPKRVGS